MFFYALLLLFLLLVVCMAILASWIHSFLIWTGFDFHLYVMCACACISVCMKQANLMHRLFSNNVNKWFFFFSRVVGCDSTMKDAIASDVCVNVNPLSTSASTPVTSTVTHTTATRLDSACIWLLLMGGGYMIWSCVCCLSICLSGWSSELLIILQPNLVRWCISTSHAKRLI